MGFDGDEETDSDFDGAELIAAPVPFPLPVDPVELSLDPSTEGADDVSDPSGKGPVEGADKVPPDFVSG